MECSLGPGDVQTATTEALVLILILMECSLGLEIASDEARNKVCLNPYSNGMLTWCYAGM